MGSAWKSVVLGLVLGRAGIAGAVDEAQVTLEGCLAKASSWSQKRQCHEAALKVWDEELDRVYGALSRSLDEPSRAQLEKVFWSQNHGSLSAAWFPADAKENQSLLVTYGGKWGPRDILLVRIEGGKITSQIHVWPMIEKAFADKAKAAASKGSGGIQPGVINGTASFDEMGRVIVEADSDSSPKRMENEETWLSTLKARLEPGSDTLEILESKPFEKEEASN